MAYTLRGRVPAWRSLRLCTSRNSGGTTRKLVRPLKTLSVIRRSHRALRAQGFRPGSQELNEMNYMVLLTLQSKIKDGDPLTDAERKLLFELLERERRYVRTR